MRYVVLLVGILCAQEPTVEPPVARHPADLRPTDSTMELNLLRMKLERAAWCEAVANCLVDRYLQPVNLWLRFHELSSEPLTEDRWPKKGEARWYCLRIRAENVHAGTDLVIKFCLDPQKREKWTYTGEDGVEHTALDDDGTESRELMLTYASRIRDGLRMALLKYFVDSVSDPDARETLVTGSARLYRIATENTDPARVRKEDEIK